MNRRTLLHRSAPLASLAWLAGCLGDANRDTAGDPTKRETTRRTARTTREESRTTTEFGDDERAGDGPGGDGLGDFSGIDSDAEEPFRSLSVGKREGVAFPDNNRPRDVRVWNDADEPREITVRVARGAKDLLDRTVAFAADAYLAVALNEPADYRVAVGLADETPTTFRVRRRSFDCNATTTDVGVGPDGRVETVTASTAAGCSAPEVAATDLSVGDGDCGTTNRASVAFDGERVRVDGTVRAPTPGADLELAEASYDADSGELTVQVRATEGDDGPGVQCVGAIPYEATVDFEYDLPGEAVVVHENSDGTVEVARASRGAS